MFDCATQWRRRDDADLDAEVITGCLTMLSVGCVAKNAWISVDNDPWFLVPRLTCSVLLSPMIAGITDAVRCSKQEAVYDTDW